MCVTSEVVSAAKEPRMGRVRKRKKMLKENSSQVRGFVVCVLFIPMAFIQSCYRSLIKTTVTIILEVN